MIFQTKITEQSNVIWKNVFSKREYEYLTHVINGLIAHGEQEHIAVQYGERNGCRVLHIFEPFCALNHLGYSSPSVVSISFKSVKEIQFLTGGDNGLEIFSPQVTLESTVPFPKNSAPEIDFWHFVDAIGVA